MKNDIIGLRSLRKHWLCRRPYRVLVQAHKKMHEELNNTDIIKALDRIRVWTGNLPGIHGEAIRVWKDCRNDLKALEDTL